MIFTRGTTEAINLVAASFGRKFIREGDEIIVSALEHHSDIVPWQMVAEACGARVRVIPMNDAGGMSGVEQDILYCVVTRLEIGKVKGIVRDLDDRAFVVFHPLAGAEGGRVKTRGFH